MGVAGSLSIGNSTVTNIVNQTSNEQYFTMTNSVSIINTLKSESNLISAAEAEGKNEVLNKVVMTVKDSEFIISGSDNTVRFTAEASSEQNIETAVAILGYLEHTENLTDTVAFSIANDGASMLSNVLNSTGTASQAMECDASGIGTVAFQAGIANTVMTNITNSVRNVFAMTVSNYMSSYTNRETLANNVSTAYASSTNIAENIEEFNWINNKLNISGNNNLFEMSTKTESTQGVVITASLTSNLTKAITASVSSEVSSKTKVTGEVINDIKSVATSTGDNSVGAGGGMEKILQWVAIAAIVLGGLFLIGGVIKHVVGAKNKPPDDPNNPNNNPNGKPQTSGIGNPMGMVKVGLDIAKNINNNPALKNKMNELANTASNFANTYTNSFASSAKKYQ